jgi:replicative DNA helicase
VKIATLYNRQIPHSMEAEMALLGCIMLDPRTLADARRHIRGAADFYNEHHATIYRALLDLHNREGDTLATQLVDALRRSHRLDAVGGEDYIARLLEATPSVSMSLWAAKRVAEDARLRRVLDAADKIMYSVLHRGAAETTDEVCNRAVELLVDAARAESATQDIHIADAMRAVMEQLERQERITVPTGIARFDNDLGGVPKHGLYTVYGYTSSGKTTLTLQIAEGLVSIHKFWGRVFSYEQPSKRVAATVLSARAQVPVHQRWNLGERPTLDEWGRMRGVQEMAQGWNLEIVEQNMDAAAIFARCVEYREKHGPNGVIVVDYIQNLPPMAADLVRSTEESMRWLQRIARDLELLVFAVCQVNREGGKSGSAPKITDAYGGMAIESKSDCIAAVYRPHLNDPMPSPDDTLAAEEYKRNQELTQIHLLKDKYGGKGLAVLRFDRPHLRFE